MDSSTTNLADTIRHFQDKLDAIQGSNKSSLVRKQRQSVIDEARSAGLEFIDRQGNNFYRPINPDECQTEASPSSHYGEVAKR